MSKPSSQQLTEAPIRQTVLIGLLLLLSLAATPHIWHVAPRIMVPFYAMVLLRLLAVFYPSLLPKHWVLLLLMLISLANAASVILGNLDKEMGVTLLTAMLGMKILELRNVRDIYVLTFLGFFLIVTQFLFNQGMGYTFFLLAVSIGLIGILIELNGPERTTHPISLPLRIPLQNAGIMFIAALPAMLALFVLFPRLPGPLWAIGLGDVAITGITDRIRPGEVSRLSQSSEIAFRVRFEGEPPAANKRYWRGPVLWQTDGAAWTRLERPVFTKLSFMPQGPAYDYELTIEKTGQRWLFALERPAGTVKNTRWTSDYQMLAVKPIRKRLTVNLRSYTDFKDKIFDFDIYYAFEHGLQLPNNITPRMRGLARQWRSEGKTDIGVVQAALTHFREQPFVYTLSPPKLGDNPTDEFLFETQKGFCGHYATSFALIMRLAGIPSRVIGGYQGGELNPVGGHFIVRQSDAHAWTEVWIEHQGWIRVDPTSAVSPDRIEQSVQPNTAADTGAPVLFRLRNPDGFAGLIRQAGWMLDNLDMQWHRWVVGFTENTQRSVLKKMGLGFLDGYALGIATIFVAILALMAGILLFRIRGRTHRDPVQNAYLSLRRHLQFAGVRLPVWLGPKDTALLAGRRLPKQAKILRPLLNEYIDLRYGIPHSAQQQRKFVRKIRLYRLRTLLPLWLGKRFHHNRHTLKTNKM